jgi:predicted enzyme related to lactoylglutathione lyase
MEHLINWVEIPANDLKRASNFYATILNVQFIKMPLGASNYALFPCDNTFNCGALVQGPHHKPCADGIIIYLDGGKDLDVILKKVKKAGGEVVMEKVFLSKEAGYVGMFIDTEGNKIGLQHM